MTEISENNTPVIVPEVKPIKQKDISDSVENLYFFTNREDFTPYSELTPQEEKLAEKLTVSASDIADTYLLSLVLLEDNDVDTVRKLGVSPKKWAALHAQEDSDVSALMARKYFLADDIAQKHIMATLGFVSYMFKNATPLARSTFGQLIHAVNNNEPMEKILSGIQIRDVTKSIRAYWAKNKFDIAYSEILTQLEELETSRVEAKNTWDYGLIITRITLLHNTVHHIGGTILERIIHPKDKNLSQELLLRFASDNSDFGAYSARKFGSPEGRKIAGLHKVRNRKEFSSDEEQFLIAEELVREIDANYFSDELYVGKMNWKTVLIQTIGRSRFTHPLFQNVWEINNDMISRFVNHDDTDNILVGMLKRGIAHSTIDSNEMFNLYVEAESLTNHLFSVIGEKLFDKLDTTAKSKVWSYCYTIATTNNLHDCECSRNFLTGRMDDFINTTDLTVEQKIQIIGSIRKFFGLYEDDHFELLLRKSDSPLAFISGVQANKREILNDGEHTASLLARMSPDEIQVLIRVIGTDKKLKKKIGTILYDNQSLIDIRKPEIKKLFINL